LLFARRRPMGRIDRLLLGEAGLLDTTTATAIGIPRAAPGGNQWKLSRAALPYSLKSVLATCNEDGATLQMERDRLAAALDPATKALHRGDCARGVLQ
jgi:hypothetical protein